MIRIKYEPSSKQYNIINDAGDISFMLADVEVIALAEQIYQTGLISDPNYIQGELTATKLHLADMRRLVLLENKEGEV